MSWDIFVQDIPPDVKSVEEIPGDFEPRPLGGRQEIIDAILRAVPTADFSETSWGRIEGSEYSIEVNIGDADPVMSFAMHVYGDEPAVLVVQRILAILGVRAFDPSSSTGIFDMPSSSEGFLQWKEFRSTALERGGMQRREDS